MKRNIFRNTFVIAAALYVVVTGNVAWSAKATAYSFTDLLEQDDSYFDNSYNDNVEPIGIKQMSIDLSLGVTARSIDKDNDAMPLITPVPIDNIIVPGCMDASASNFNLEATEEDNSCIFRGCTDEEAANYNWRATEDDDSCIFISGCTDETATNYSPDATKDDGSCVHVIAGCMNVKASNYNENANEQIYI